VKTARDDFSRSEGVHRADASSGSGLNPSPAKEERANILWLIAEDLCPDLGCYGEKLARTPNLDRLASEGARFTNAFLTSPVCSPSRSAFMTGMYQTSIGAHHHRSHRRDNYRLPQGVRLITDYLREAGYFTANVITAAPGVEGRGKTDFNFTVENPFDGTDWNERKPGQPFYAQVNFRETHRIFEEVKENAVDPELVKIPPYYPDHPVARADWARYLDAIGILDRKVGAVLKRLEDEGLAGNTVVIFFGDNGRPHVRGKQFLYEGGILTPLIVRWPGRIKAGTVSDDLVSAIDLSATSLEIAGIEPPAHMQGVVFLGPEAQKREYIVAARDRCDETMDRIRCIRTKRFKYIRNFMPERPYAQLNRYKETYPVMRLMRRLHKEGKLTPEQALFMAERRPEEELYELQADPHELNNLASSPSHQELLQKMRRTLADWIKETGDMGEVPEDPAVTAHYEKAMKKSFDEKIKKLYESDAGG